MIDKQIIQSIIEQHIAGSDKFIVDIKISGGNSIEVVLDCDTSINLDDCITANKAIEATLNRDEEDYELTVFSAGLSEPLKLVRQYIKHTGKEIELVLKTGMKQKGILGAVTNNGFELSYQVKELLEGKKRKQLVDKTTPYTYDQVKTAKLIINFK